MLDKYWVCYLIKSVDSEKTYIGATNNLVRRLNDHCRINGKSKGAKYTAGEMWYVVLYIEGFKTRKECLSFEYQFKHISKNNKIDLSSYNLPNKTTIDKRIRNLYKLFIQNKNYHKWQKEHLRICFEENFDKTIIDGVNKLNNNYGAT